MENKTEEFFKGLRRDYIHYADERGNKYQYEFLRIYTQYLHEKEMIRGFNHCYKWETGSGMRVDGYHNEEQILDLFILDYDSRENLETISKAEVLKYLNRLHKFFTEHKRKPRYNDLEKTDDVYSLSKIIYDEDIIKVNLHLISERTLSDRVNSMQENEISKDIGIKMSLDVWDISRLEKLISSVGKSELIDIDFKEMGYPIPCLKANLGLIEDSSYLAVISGDVLAKLYRQYNTRLLKENVRVYLQHSASRSINAGIRRTILNTPKKFFSYNNGITAVADKIEVEKTDSGMIIVNIKNFQIVNGGQTTACLYYASEESALDNIFLQMKITEISEESDIKVTDIVEYSNKQNAIKKSDYTSNTAFHVKMENLSRSLCAKGANAMAETKWYYERLKSQYKENENLYSGSKRKFAKEYPSNQKMDKEKFALYRNLLEIRASEANLVSSKNYNIFHERVNSEWDESNLKFNAEYFCETVGMAILYKETDRLVKKNQLKPAINIVKFTILLILDLVAKKGQSIDFMSIWKLQNIPDEFIKILNVTAPLVLKNLEERRLNANAESISEWSKKPEAWIDIQGLSMKLVENNEDVFENFFIKLCKKDNF